MPDTTTNETILAQLAAISAKVDASRAEGERRGEKHTKDLEHLRGSLESLTRRVTTTEGAITEIRKEQETRAATSGQHDLERAAELGGAVGKIMALEGMVKTQLDTQDRVQKGLIHSLGLDYDALAMPTPDNPAEAKKHAVTIKRKTTMEQKVTVTTVVTLLILGLELVIKLLH